MCLAVPMKIEKFIDANRAVVSRDGMELEIDTSLLEEPQIGDYVIVHAGFALEKLDIDEAEERIDLFQE